MSEENNCCSQDCEKPQLKVKTKRDIFRFKGEGQDMALNLDHVYKIVHAGNRISFVPVAADPDKESCDYVDFENEEASEKAMGQILNIWCSEYGD